MGKYFFRSLSVLQFTDSDYLPMIQLIAEFGNSRNQMQVHGTCLVIVMPIRNPSSISIPNILIELCKVLALLFT